MHASLRNQLFGGALVTGVSQPFTAIVDDAPLHFFTEAPRIRKVSNAPKVLKIEKLTLE
jgi:hypothetical protein